MPQISESLDPRPIGVLLGPTCSGKTAMAVSLSGRMRERGWKLEIIGADARLASALRLALHWLAKPWYQRRAVSLFLDQSSLSANAALWPALEKALGTSDYFLLLASPASTISCR